MKMQEVKYKKNNINKKKKKKYIFITLFRYWIKNTIPSLYNRKFKYELFINWLSGIWEK